MKPDNSKEMRTIYNELRKKVQISLDNKKASKVKKDSHYHK